MSIFELLFGFQGRINRAQWWLGQLTALGLAAIFFTIWSGWIASYGLSAEIIKSSPPSTQIKILSSMLVVGMIISSTLVWMLFSLAIKRAHDREQSGWRALAFGLPFLFAIVLPNTATQTFAALTLLWYVVELGALSGSQFHNAYGPATTRDDESLDHVDPLDLSLAENIERSLAGGRKARSPETAGSDDLEIGEWPARDRPATFGRRAPA